VQSTEIVRKRALEIARTGQHIDCLTIEMALEREGHSDAFEALKDDEFRARLKAICDAHWRPEAVSYASNHPGGYPGDGNDDHGH
jgi:hypothetical protein